MATSPKRNNKTSKSKTHKKVSSSSSASTAQSTELNNMLGMLEKLLHWAAIIDSSDDAIISKSIDGYITSWNRGAQNLYGYTPEEIIGKPVSVLMPEGKKDDFPFIMKQLRKGLKVDHYITQRITKDGKIIDVSITVSPIKDPQGKLIGASKIARDVTEKVDQERRRQEFVSTASHELKTPITSQKIFGEILEKLIDKNGHTEYKPYIQRINQQTDKMTKLIEDLLDLSRLNMNRLRIEQKKFKFDDLVKEIITLTRLTAKHTIILSGKTGRWVKGDRERLGQVLTNLLSNAIKYSPKADKIIVSSTINQDKIQLSIQDFGIGIPKDYHTRIFEKFYRVTDNNEKTYPGMGIGLHLCQEIMLRHSGEIWVTSEKGKGSTFYISLPYIK